MMTFVFTQPERMLAKRTSGFVMRGFCEETEPEAVCAVAREYAHAQWQHVVRTTQQTILHLLTGMDISSRGCDC